MWLNFFFITSWYQRVNLFFNSETMATFASLVKSKEIFKKKGFEDSKGIFDSIQFNSIKRCFILKFLSYINFYNEYQRRCLWDRGLSSFALGDSYCWRGSNKYFFFFFFFNPSRLLFIFHGCVSLPYQRGLPPPSGVISQQKDFQI